VPRGARPGSIRRRLTLQVLLVGLVPLLLLAAVAALTVERAAGAFQRGLDASAHAMEQQLVAAGLVKAAEDLAARIDAYVAERVKDVKIWASAPPVVEAAVRGDALARQRGWPRYPELAGDEQAVARIEAEMRERRSLDPVPAATQYLRDQLAAWPTFRELFVTDRNGYNVAVSNPTSDFVQSDEEWWVRAWEHGVDIGGTTLNPRRARAGDEPTGARVVFDESAGVWSLAIAVRVDHPRTGQPVGVLKAVLDISAVQALATRVAATIPGADVKVVVAATGDLVADTAVQHARRFVMTREGNLLARRFAPAEALARRDGARTGYLVARAVGGEGEQVVGWARTAGRGDFAELPDVAGLGWGVIVGQPKAVAFAALGALGGVQATLAAQRRALPAVIAGVVALAAAGLLGLGLVVGRRLTVPIRELSDAARRVSTGDLAVQVPVRSADELGQLALTFNETVRRLSTLVRTEAERDEERRQREALQRNIMRFLDVATEIARGDLTRRGEVTADVLGSVVDAVNLMVEELSRLVGDVRRAAQQVAASAAEVIVALEQTAAGAQAQAREATAVAGAMEALTTSVRRVADHAVASAQAARRALEASERGDQAVRATLAGMEKIRGEVQAIARRITSLADRALEISEIVTTIEDFAGQTNLLALNAAIEAAGAGEYGQRFTVVADEIRKLAERSARAAKEIGGLIRTVQAETQEAVLAMDEGTAEVERGHRLALEAGESLRAIAAIARESAALADGISGAAREQVRGVEHAAVAVQTIAGVAVQTEKSVVDTRRTMDQLVALADELLAGLARFKLSPEGRP